MLPGLNCINTFSAKISHLEFDSTQFCMSFPVNLVFLASTNTLPTYYINTVECEEPSYLA